MKLSRGALSLAAGVLACSFLSPFAAHAASDTDPVLDARAVDAVDGVSVSWTVPTPSSGGTFEVERTTDGTDWTVLATVSNGEDRYADTAAPTGTPSTYRITPVESGVPDPAGAATTGQATPISGWSPPTGAATLESVDGFDPVTGAPAVSVDASNADVIASHSRPGLNLGLRGGTEWTLGQTPVGDAAGQVGGSWNDSSNSNTYGMPLLSGTLDVTRLVVHADGTPAEFAATFTGTRQTPDGGSAPVTALIRYGTTPATLPGYLVAQVPADRLPFYAHVDDGALRTLVGDDMVADFPLQLRNIGGASVTPTTEQTVSQYVTPPSPTPWTVAGTCLNVPLAAGATCSTSVRYANGVTTGLATWTTTAQQSASQLLYADSPGTSPTVTLDAPALVQHGGTVTVTSYDPYHDPNPMSLYCRLDHGDFTPCTTPWQLTNLPDGAHTVTVFGITSSQTEGRMSQWGTAQIETDHTGPVTRLTSPSHDPAVVFTTSPWLGWDTNDGGGYGTRYIQARVRTATPTTGYSSYTIPSWGRRSVSNGNDTSIAPGQERCWTARAVDTASQWGAWSAGRCFLKPLDDRSLTAHGFTRTSRSSAFQGTLSSAHTTGATLTLRGVNARKVGLLLNTAPGNGTLAAYLGGTRIGTISDASTTARSKVVAWLPHLATTRTGPLVLRTTSGKPVTIDGLLVRHR